MNIMKNLVLVLLLFIAGNVSSQNTNDFFNALKNKDTNTISNFLSSDVDLCIESYQDYISQSEALAKIKEFLDNENPVSYEVIHNGKSEKSNYKVAKLKTNTGIYRVFIYFEKLDNTLKISEIRFDL